MGFAHMFVLLPDGFLLDCLPTALLVCESLFVSVRTCPLFLHIFADSVCLSLSAAVCRNLTQFVSVSVVVFLSPCRPELCISASVPSLLLHLGSISVFIKLYMFDSLYLCLSVWLLFVCLAAFFVWLPIRLSVPCLVCLCPS